MSDTKNKILQVLNDNYMVNLFSAQAREHIASKIVENLDGNYDANPAPQDTVPIQNVEEDKNKSTSVKSDKKEKPSPKPKTKTSVKPIKQNLGKRQTERKRSSLRNLNK